MAEILKKVDVVTVGAGWTGGIIAAELTKAGLNVLSLERGHMQSTENFNFIHDAWRYGVNYGLMQDCSKDTLTFCHSPRELALPMRKLGSFLLGNNVGGAGVHWSGHTFRFTPYDFEIKSRSFKRYGNKLGDDYTLQDWGLTYKDMEPYYDKFEKTCGISGEPNPLAEKMGSFRSNPYPQKPLENTKILKRFENAAKEMNLHTYRLPAGTSRSSYVNPDGQELAPCEYCSFCERYGCEYGAKASPITTVIPKAMSTGKYTIRTYSNATQILKKDGKVTGVKFVDTRTMKEYIQPADIVVLTSFVFNNAKLLMVSEIGSQYDPKTGKGTLGKNYCYQIRASSTAFFEEQFNTFMGSGSLGITCDDFNADNFDHSKEKFLHGAALLVTQKGTTPNESVVLPKGAPKWGEQFKKIFNESYTRSITIGSLGASLPHKNNYLSLDPIYKDAFGMPLLRLTYNFTDQDRALNKFITDKTAQIAKRMKGVKSIKKGSYLKNYSIVPYQTTHNTGGTTMGANPEMSVVNTYLQHWDADNLFVVGAGNFQHNSGYNPTDTVGALAYRCAEGILKYHKSGKILA
ncbi:GMC family oxidoreductase [Campylobacter molothri]|uniref:GMC family oxidoreductase n=1 Tax=Campylobacter molothri TaxID=1032242 RepID=UPI001EBE9EB0|nr:GMC family oxidoreductase [Campylobacter sp. RM10535]